MIKTFKGDSYKDVDKQFNNFENETHIEVIHMTRYCDTKNNHYLSVYYKPKHFNI